MDFQTRPSALNTEVIYAQRKRADEVAGMLPGKLALRNEYISVPTVLQKHFFNLLRL
jgi:hypothetical protein